jgi:acyl-CoA dehydrogenase
MTYAAPVSAMLHTFKMVGVDALYTEDFNEELFQGILEEAAKTADNKLAPENKKGDKSGVIFKDGNVTMPAGWKALYKDWCDGGWNGLPASPEYGGQGLPYLLNTACLEMWNAANPSFGIGPVLTQGAVEALNAHGSEALKTAYLPQMIEGSWTGTMNLTEPSAGSDLSVVRSKAVKAGDHYLITGQKIFITWGEQDLTENIIHLVLARLPDAPAGTKGISLFLVPKILPDGTRNDLRAHSVEHKLGLHASPTCTMIFGDKGGAIGYLIGEENRGLNCMFTMMNNARLAVAIQGVAVAERAYQQALSYARDRVQGRMAIIHHPDVKRNLLTMKALTYASRALCYRTAIALDLAHHGDKLKGQEAALLTPVAKAFSTDNGIEVASLGVQVHGGMGFIEETGAAQHMRDARIYAIYEGTNGIQAIDLVTRKLTQEGVVAREILRHEAVLTRLKGVNTSEYGATLARFSESLDAFKEATRHILSHPEQALAGATPYTKLFGLTAGASALIEEAMMGGDIALARFMAEHLLPQTSGLSLEITAGAASLEVIL